MMAAAAKVTIAEVEHLVEAGELDGDQIHTPSVYVKRIFRVSCMRSGLRGGRCGRLALFESFGGEGGRTP
jgi:hypothetical protein